MSINQAAWEEPFAQEFAHNLVVNNLTMRNESDFDKVQSILIRIVMKYSQHYSAAITLNPRVIELIDHYVKEYKEHAPFKTTAIPSGSSVFQGQAVQANLIGDNDNGYIDATYEPGKKNTLHKRLTSMFGMTSKKPIATPVGGKRKTKKTKKDKKTRKHRKKRV